MASWDFIEFHTRGILNDDDDNDNDDDDDDDNNNNNNNNNNNKTVYRSVYTTKPQPLSEIRTEKSTVTIRLIYCHFPFFFDVLRVSTLYYTESTWTN